MMATGAELGGTSRHGRLVQGQSEPPKGDARRALSATTGPRADDRGSAAGRDGACVITWWPKLRPGRGGIIRRGTWERLFEALSRPMPRFLGDDHPGWSPATFERGQRSLETVRAVSAIVLDHDAGEVALDRALFAWVGAMRLGYTTKSHEAAAPCWRIVLPLSRLVTAAEQARIWTWAAARMEERCKLDTSTRDASRFWYWPCRTEAGVFEVLAEPGPLLDVDEVLELARELAAVVPAPPPPMPAPAPSSSPGMAVIDRARAYLERVPGAISGQRGHVATLLAAEHVVRGFQLDERSALCVLAEWNAKCEPPWSERELAHKIRQAARHGSAVSWGQHLRGSR